MNAVMDAKTHACGACRATAGLCVAHKSLLTNRIRRHFARIKAGGDWIRADQGYRSKLSGKSPPSTLTRRSRAAQETFKERPGDVKLMTMTFRSRKSGHFEAESQDISKPKVRTFRKRKSGHFASESQDISQAKVRTFRGRRPGRSCRPPFHFRLRHECANDVPFPPRSPARRCDRPAGRSARRD
jgi:hypothetical protein